jgi:hypothetical protein
MQDVSYVMRIRMESVPGDEPACATPPRVRGAIFIPLYSWLLTQQFCGENSCCGAEICSYSLVNLGKGFFPSLFRAETHCDIYTSCTYLKGTVSPD